MVLTALSMGMPYPQGLMRLWMLLLFTVDPLCCGLQQSSHSKNSRKSGQYLCRQWYLWNSKWKQAIGPIQSPLSDCNDGGGNIYVLVKVDPRIRKVPSLEVTTYAGTDQAGFQEWSALQSQFQVNGRINCRYRRAMFI